MDVLFPTKYQNPLHIQYHVEGQEKKHTQGEREAETQAEEEAGSMQGLAE